MLSRVKLPPSHTWQYLSKDSNRTSNVKRKGPAFLLRITEAIEESPMVSTLNLLEMRFEVFRCRLHFHQVICRKLIHRASINFGRRIRKGQIPDRKSVVEGKSVIERA